MAVGAKSIMLNDTRQGANLIPEPPEEQVHEDTFNQRLDTIYDEEPLGFEKDPRSSSAKMLAQDPLEEIDLGDGPTKRVIYISAKLDPKMKNRLVELLKKNRDCFAWDYDEIPGLKRDLVELKLPIKDGKKPIKQTPRRFTPEILLKIKKEVERLLRCNFIRTTRVCIDFRDLNAATRKDEYPMHVAEMLVDSAAGYEYLSMFDGYSGYNQIFIAEEDVSKTAFRCPGEIGTYEWIVYIDDIVIKSISDEDHLTHLSQSFERMRKHGSKMNPLKWKINFLRRFISNLSGRIQAFSPLLGLKHGNFEWTNEHQEAFEEIKQYLTNPPILSPPSQKKPMRLYISASDTTIGSMLAQEDENAIERATYYLSRVLIDAKTRYTLIEKLCLCLHFSGTKLKYYIKPIDLYVSSHFDVIKYILSKPIMHIRIGKWALALTEYSLALMPLKAMKGQVVSDFILDHAVVENPQILVELMPWRLFFDGSTHKDGSGVGILLIYPDGIPRKLKYRIEGPLCRTMRRNMKP
ncbi:uncharacterized protein LOC131662300 [Vicia villosa]|uniref:uncharacterized protein LOC131662300 n=1 Tax=Vicia villosa TaxID=3911 RepID=UPI00273BFD29|nr:uncharacterized protein LOC131662300 [Vicia villosa]